MKREIFYQNNYKLTPAEREVINYIENNADLFINMSITELAKKTYVSASSISKLLKKMNFKNYKQLQQWVLVQKNKLDEGVFITTPTSTAHIINNVKLSYERGISRTISDLDHKVINEAIRIIKVKEYIFTYGIGSSSLAAQELASGLTIMAYNASKQNSIHDIFLKLNDVVCAKSVIIIYSKTLSSLELVVLRNILHQLHVLTILVTANSSIKSKTNETIIFFRTYEQKTRVTAMSSKISQLMITDIIVNKLNQGIKNQAYACFDQVWRNKKNN